PIVLRLGDPRSRPPFLLLALPLISGLSVMHALMPPHPGPVAAITAIHADTGMVLLWGAVVGVPTAVIAGPLFARIVGTRLAVAWPAPLTKPDSMPAQTLIPGLGMTLSVILLPIGLMLAATAGELFLDPANQLRAVIGFMGDPKVALLVSVLFTTW